EEPVYVVGNIRNALDRLPQVGKVKRANLFVHADREVDDLSDRHGHATREGGQDNPHDVDNGLQDTQEGTLLAFLDLIGQIEQAGLHGFERVNGLLDHLLGLGDGYLEGL